MDAVRRGDLVTAQRLVDAAAKKAGYGTKGFHRTAKTFTKFIPGGLSGETQIWRTKSGEIRTLFGPSGRAIWFGSSPENLPAYHNDPTGKGVVLKVLLKNPSPLLIDDDTRDWARDVYADGSKEFPLLLSDEHIRNIRGDGYTGIEYWRKGKTSEKSSPDEMVVFDPTQIKSADPVTYDDSGQVIPLSQRFNDQSDDIRNPRTTPKQFPYAYAAYLKAHFPAIWAAGGNIRGNDTYRWWTAYRKGDRSPTVMHWWNVTRPAWIARHYRDYRLPGVIAQIKWGTVGNLGVAGMKRVVEDAIRKRYAN
jgi:hypothetical protein